MANTIILKRSSQADKVPTTSQLALGEIAINTFDGKVYIKSDSGVPAIVEIGGALTGDVTSSGNATTLATVATAGATGSSTAIPIVTINVKGLVTSISTAAVVAPAGTLSGSTLASGVTASSLTSVGTLTSLAMGGNILPTTHNTHSLGSLSYQWKDIYVGPGTLYVNGSPVIQDDSGTMTFTADVDQNIRLTTVGAGLLQLGSSTTGVNVDGTLTMASGKRIVDSAGTEVGFGDAIQMNSNKIIGLGTPSAGTDAATKGYVDSEIAAISTTTISQGNSNVAVVDSGTGSVLVTVDGSTALTVDATGVVVAGNFTVSGTTTTVNSSTISLADNILTLNSDATGVPTQNAGIEVERGDEANTQLRWNEGSTIWTFTNDGATYYPIVVNTDGLGEGVTNQYHTTARARTSLSSSSNTGISYDSSSGNFSLGSIPNSALSNGAVANLSGTNTGDQTITLTGGVTGTGTGSFAATVITNANLTGDVTSSGSNATTLAAGSASNLDSGTLLAARMPALTGDITTVAGAVASTLATVATAGVTGSSTAIPVITINVKGLTTSITTAAVVAPAGTLSGATLASGVTASSLTSVGTISSGTWSSTVSTSVNSTMSGTLATGALTTTGAITATGEITAFFSDARLKKDVVAIQDPIAKIMSIRGVTFRPNETALAMGIVDSAQVGVIAQEVEEVMPELVCPSAFPGFLTVKYDKLTALLIEAVKAQQGQIDALTAQIAKLSGPAAL